MNYKSIRFTLLIAGCLSWSAGCSSIEHLPAGTQLQSSTFGLKFAPQALDGTPLVLGSHSMIVTSAIPADAGVNLNRFEATAPWAHIKSTVATGAIGEQIRQAGGPAALEHLLGDGGNRTSNAELRTSNFESDQIELGEPFPLPRTDLLE